MSHALVKHMLKCSRTKFQQYEVNAALDDGSTIVCHAHVQNYRKSESGMRGVTWLKNIMHSISGRIFNDERVFIAARETDGTVLLCMLYVPEHGDDTKKLAKLDLSRHLDGDFHKGREYRCPRLADITLKDVSYTLPANNAASMDKGRFMFTFGAGFFGIERHFDFTVESPEARTWLTTAARQQAAETSPQAVMRAHGELCQRMGVEGCRM